MACNILLINTGGKRMSSVSSLSFESIQNNVVAGMQWFIESINYLGHQVVVQSGPALESACSFAQSSWIELSTKTQALWIQLRPYLAIAVTFFTSNLGLAV